MTLEEALAASPARLASRVTDDGRLVIATEKSGVGRTVLAEDGVSSDGEPFYRAARLPELLANDWMPETTTLDDEDDDD